MLRLTVILVLALGASPTLARAVQVAPDTLRLSAAEAVQQAMLTNEESRIARAGVDRTEGLVREAYSLALPAIDGTYRFQRNLQRPVLFFNQNGETQQITIGDQHENLFSISVEQPLFDASLGAAVSAARAGNAASEAFYERALSTVARRAREAYYQVLRTRSRVLVQEGAIRLVEARLGQIRLFHEVGTASDFDLLTAEVDVEAARPFLILARNDASLAVNALRRVVGLPLDAPLALTDSLAFDPETVTLDDAIARAFAQRGDLAAQRRTVELREELVAVERAAGFPSLALQLDVSRRASSEDVVPEDRDFSQAASAAIELSIPIFDGRRASGRALQARADYVEAFERLHALERDVRIEVMDIWQSVRAAAEGVEATRATAGRARRAYDIAVVRFRNGLSTQLELDESEQSVTAAESNAAEALYLHLLARARLRHAMGER